MTCKSCGNEVAEKETVCNLCGNNPWTGKEPNAFDLRQKSWALFMEERCEEALQTIAKAIEMATESELDGLYRDLAIIHTTLRDFDAAIDD
jgi:uncharacterized protein YukE